MIKDSIFVIGILFALFVVQLAMGYAVIEVRRWVYGRRAAVRLNQWRMDCLMKEKFALRSYIRRHTPNVRNDK